MDSNPTACEEIYIYIMTIIFICSLMNACEIKRL